MGEPSIAGYAISKVPTLSANRANQKVFVVNGAHNDSATTINVVDMITGVTAPLYLLNSMSNELIYAEGISGTTFSPCVRGADGTTKAPMNSGDVLFFCITANDINQIIREVLAIAIDTSAAVETERIRLQSSIRDEVMRYIKDRIQFDWNTTHFLRGDKTFASVRDDIPAPNSNVTHFLRGDATWAIPPTTAIDGREFDIIVYSQIFK